MTNRDFLIEEVLNYWCKRMQTPDDAAQILRETADAIRCDESLAKLFHSWQLKFAVGDKWIKNQDVPWMDDIVKEEFTEPSLFYFLAYLSTLPWMEDRYQERGIPTDIFEATISNLPTTLVNNFKATGRWHFTLFNHLWRYLDLDLISLGRMNYRVETYPGKGLVFENLNDHSIKVLCVSDFPLRPDGYANGAGGTTVDDPWFAFFEEDDSCWRGNPIDKAGFVLRETITLKKSEWQLALKPGDPVLEMHIPWHRKFEPQDCLDSVLMAEKIFPQCFPERPFKKFYSHTWMFTAQLKDFLPQESNIMQFNKQFHKLPFPGGIKYLWEFVFPLGTSPENIENLPRDTSLRRAVIDHIKRGGEFFDLEGILPNGSKGWEL